MFPIIQKRKIPFTISILLVIASFVLVFTLGLKPGLDFTGGTLLEFNFSEARPQISEVQQALAPLNLGSMVLQQTGDKGYLLKTQYIDETQHQNVLTNLRKSFEKGNNKVLENKIETIGPSVSSELKAQAVKMGIAVVIGIVLYIAYSFRKVSRPIASWKFGVAAVVALVHDVIITVGIFVLLGHYFGVEVDIAFVVAMLTILGYSVNDTIVVFDRIREKLIRSSSKVFAETVNIAVNETIARSINTSLTVMLTLLALFFYGGSSIHYFSLALIIGVFFGTYSSIFVASSLLVSWEEWERKNR